ncbi:MAG: glycolate oxidase subunit GlcE [Pseudomonadota bacterium]
MNQDLSLGLQHQVRAAAASGTPLLIRGGNTKHFLGNPSSGTPLEVSGHRGITSYEPVELVISARAGTPLRELEQALDAAGQMLPFEPPHFGVDATLGGTIACGLSGPRRPYLGSARDYVLGVRMINGQGELLRFGGEVMKNVAGYDVARLLTGAMGTLGVLLEISLKVLPRPEAEVTLVQRCEAETALTRMNQLAATPLPLSASVYDGTHLYLRLSGSESAVRAARASIGGDTLNNAGTYWRWLREHQLPFFEQTAPLWRLSLPSNAPSLDLPGATLIEWGGAQRWLKSTASAEAIRAATAEYGGHATLFRGDVTQTAAFHPLAPGLETLHRNLKHAFDPHAIFNRGRMYPEW